MNRRSFLFSQSIPAAAVLMGGIPQGHSKPVDPIGNFKPLIQRDRLPNPVIIESLELYKRGGAFLSVLDLKMALKAGPLGTPARWR